VTGGMQASEQCARVDLVANGGEAGDNGAWRQVEK
jgi:hypothetical protein